MKTTRLMAVAVVVVVSGLALHVARAQLPGVKRTDLQRHDLSVPGREVVQVRVDFPPGVVAPKHSHPGEEIVYAIEGLLEYQLEGEPPLSIGAPAASPTPIWICSSRSTASISSSSLGSLHIPASKRPFALPLSSATRSRW